MGPPVLACIRSWGQHGMPVGVINVSTNPFETIQSKYLTSFKTLKECLLFTDKGIDEIISFLVSFNASEILTINEYIAIWLNENLKKLPEHTQICLPPNEIIKRSLSKRRQCEAAQKAGLQLLPTYYIDKKNQFEISPSHYPICIRPDRWGAVEPNFKVQIIPSEEKFKEFINTLEKISSPLIVQPFKQLPNLVVHGSRTKKGRTKWLQSFFVGHKYKGLTLTIKPFKAKQELYERCKLFTEILELEGNYHFEFLYNFKSQEAFFLEINLRLGGTTAKVFQLGYNEPLHALETFSGHIFQNDTIKKGIVSNKKALVDYGIHALLGKLTPLDYPCKHRYSTVIETLYGLLFYKDEIITLHDLRGSVGLYLNSFKALFNFR